MKESYFQSNLIKEIKRRFPGCIVMKNDSAHRQGIPDISILYGDRYAVLECKRSEDAPHQPNQDYYVDHINAMGGHAWFIYPENKGVILDELECAFGLEG